MPPPIIVFLISTPAIPIPIPFLISIPIPKIQLVLATSTIGSSVVSAGRPTGKEALYAAIWLQWLAEMTVLYLRVQVTVTVLTIQLSIS
jgi:hypothetical protein